MKTSHDSRFLGAELIRELPKIKSSSAANLTATLTLISYKIRKGITRDKTKRSLDQNRTEYRAFVNTAMNIQLPHMTVYNRLRAISSYTASALQMGHTEFPKRR